MTRSRHRDPAGGTTAEEFDPYLVQADPGDVVGLAGLVITHLWQRVGLGSVLGAMTDRERAELQRALADEIADWLVQRELERV